MLLMDAREKKEASANVDHQSWESHLVAEDGEVPSSSLLIEAEVGGIDSETVV